MKLIKGALPPVPGFKTAGTVSGIKKNGKKDLALIVSDTECVAAGVFTTNRVQSPSVIWSRNAIRKSKAFRAVLVNSGNANACTGPRGMEDCKTIVQAAAKALGISPRQILIASTGIIGVPLPSEKITAALPGLVAGLSPKGWEDTAQAIMTTDLVAKTAAVRFSLGGKKIVVSGIAKGSGMIHPNMATMLAFVHTNAAISRDALHRALVEANDRSFNRITVDGDTSTNDSFFVMANGQAGNKLILKGGRDYTQFVDALTAVSKDLAFKIVEDGEGATKFVTVRVSRAKTQKHAHKVAASVATSSLVKTAIFGEDPNWGRILCAAGYAGVPLQPDRIVISLNGAILFKNGTPTRNASMDALRRKMKEKNILIAIDLDNGRESTEVYTCDLSYDYVRINAEYTT